MPVLLKSRAIDRREVSALVARLADGDRAAFDPLFDRVWPFLRALCGRMLSDPADAEDAAQQALLRVFERAAAYDGRADAVPWLVAIAANECRTLRQRRNRRREVPLEAAPERATPGEAHAALEAAVTELLGALPPDDLAAVRAAWFGDPRPDVAPATFRKRLQRATERLRAAWRTRDDLA